MNKKREIEFKDTYLNHMRFCGRCWREIRRVKADMENGAPTVGIVCDGSCYDFRGSTRRDGYFHGKAEWQAVDLSTGEVVVKSHLHEQSTINIVEYLAIVDSLKHLQQIGDETTPVYSDSKIAINWVLQGYTNTALPRNSKTDHALDDLEAAAHWVERNDFPNKVLWWNKHKFGMENPADFNRK